MPTSINKSNHSEEWILSKELAKRNRTLKIILAVVVALWLVTIAGWVISSDNVSGSLFLGESDGQTLYETEVS